MSQRQAAYSRRRFLRAAARAGAVLAIPQIIPGSALGDHRAVAPSERIVIGGLGIRGRGMHDLNCMLNEPDVQFVAICDVQKASRLKVKEAVDKFYKNTKCQMYANPHEFLARPDIDAVLIATGDRWHTMAAILAAKAGKDIYSEKPCSTTIAESIALADTIKRYGVVYQAGTQRRNIGNFILAADLCHSGRLGKLHTVHANTLAPATSQEWLEPQEQPSEEDVNWDIWLGPCPWRPFNNRYIQGGWRGHFDFHGGGILEWGSHTVDLCQWAAQKDHTMPSVYDPNVSGPPEYGTNQVLCTYDDGVKLLMRDAGWLGLGTCSARYEGDLGWVETGDSGKMKTSPSVRQFLKNVPTAGTDATNHIRDFLNCIKTRGIAQSNADRVANSHIACHAAYIAWQLGRKLTLDTKKIEFVNDAEANRMRSRAYREPWRS
ncbi:MAG: Gfo/Idh/MocA family protein [Thermoguttaceae bacterium]|jgi:predicted dehydrogenase